MIEFFIIFIDCIWEWWSREGIADASQVLPESEPVEPPATEEVDRGTTNEDDPYSAPEVYQGESY